MLTDPDALSGVVVGGRYRLVRLCGSGAFGWVFEAEELVEDEDYPGEEVVGRCALKVVQPRDAQARQLVLDEMRAGAALTRDYHGLLTHLAFGKVSKQGPLHGFLYLAMELAEASLGERLRQPNRLLDVAGTRQMAQHVARHVAEGLVFLHGRGAVHRDVKPDNVLYVNGRWKLGDLGLVRPVDGSLVRTATRQGTPLYVAPEALGGEVGPVSDVWSLGVMLQECLTGVLAYDATSELVLYGALANQEPTIASDLPAPFDTIIRNCLVKDPGKRWTAAQVLDVLEGGGAPAVPAVASGPTPASGSASQASTPNPPAAPRRPASPVVKFFCFYAVFFLVVCFLVDSLELEVVGFVLLIVIGLLGVLDVIFHWWPGPTVHPMSVRSSASGAHSASAASLVALGRKRFRVDGVGSVLVQLPAGSFTMGSQAGLLLGLGGEDGRLDNEVEHKVVLSRGFLLGEAPVTQAEYAEVSGANPSRFSGNPDRPVEQVSWLDAVTFCNALSRRVGLEEAYAVNGEQVTWKGLSCLGFRLPTEAEWEYACRAGSWRARYGDLGAVAWYDGNSGGSTQSVRQKQPNAWGLYDTLGNVLEWCWDWFGDYPQGLVADPLGPGPGSGRVARGGSWDRGAQYARAAQRFIGTPGDRDGGLGFRLAKSLP